MGNKETKIGDELIDFNLKNNSGSFSTQESADAGIELDPELIEIVSNIKILREKSKQLEQKIEEFGETKDEVKTQEKPIQKNENPKIVVNTESKEDSKTYENIKNYSKRIAKIAALLIGTGLASYGLVRNSDSVNKFVYEHVNDDLANVARLPLDVAPEVAWNGIQKRMGIGEYEKNAEAGNILQSESGTDVSTKTISIEKPVVNDVWVGKSIENYKGLEVRPYIINMTADHGYKFSTYQNLDALHGSKLETIPGDGIIGGLPGVFKKYDGSGDKDKIYLIMNNGKLILKHGNETQAGEMVIPMNNQAGFDEIDTTTIDGQLMVRVKLDKNINTAVLRGRDGKDLGIGLTNKWQGKEYVPIDEARAYAQSRGGMMFVVSDDFKEQYIVGGSFQNMWDLYKKLKEKHPEKLYSFIKNDYGSYSNSLFTKNGVVTPKDQKISSARNSWGHMDMLILQRTDS